MYCKINMIDCVNFFDCERFLLEIDNGNGYLTGVLRIESFAR